MNRFLSNKNSQNKYNNYNKKNIEKMEFPELAVSKKNPITTTDASYKNMINKEIIVKKETLPEGWIVLKEGTKTSGITILQENPIFNEITFYNNIISTQLYLDKIHNKYREHFIELHGEDLYDKYYAMTDSHIYIEKEEEEEEETEDVDEDDYYE
jgi:hypothetical protein